MSTSAFLTGPTLAPISTSVAAPVKFTPKPRRRSAAKPADKSERFGSLKPIRNPIAARSYSTALLGMIPVAGAFLGPVAMAQALIGFGLRSRDPKIQGGNFATAGLLFGLAETGTNWAGLYCIARGLGLLA